jgi:hypothetical protein
MRPRDAQSWITQESRSTWNLNRRLYADEVLKDHFAVELAGLLLSNRPASEELNSKDMRSLPDPMTFSSTGNAIVEAGVSGSALASLALIVLFILTWIAERALALQRNL